eukprot:scaffold80445_cov28-Tisochrysis_lutea.AAC.3
MLRTDSFATVAHERTLPAIVLHPLQKRMRSLGERATAHSSRSLPNQAQSWSFRQRVDIGARISVDRRACHLALVAHASWKRTWIAGALCAGGGDRPFDLQVGNYRGVIVIKQGC